MIYMEWGLIGIRNTVREKATGRKIWDKYHLQARSKGLDERSGRGKVVHPHQMGTCTGL